MAIIAVFSQLNSAPARDYKNLTGPSTAKYNVKDSKAKVYTVDVTVIFKLGQVENIIIADPLEGRIYEFSPPNLLSPTEGKLKVKNMKTNKTLPADQIGEKIIDSLKTHLEVSAAAFRNKSAYAEKILNEIAGCLYDIEININTK